jgi:hypothetical protein
MTVSSTENRIEYDGNGVTTDFAFPYRFLADADLVVYVDGDLLTLTTNYMVTGAGDDAGGTVSITVPPGIGTDNVIIFRDPVAVQELDLVENDPLPAEDVEEALDLLTMLVQRNLDRIDRTINISDSDTGDLGLPPAADRANKILGFDDQGDVQMIGSEDSGILAVQLMSSSESEGSSLVMHLPSGEDAVARTVQSKLRDHMSAFDFMTSSEIEDVQAGTALVDVTTALQAAIDAAWLAGAELLLPGGTYSITGVNVYAYSRLVFDPQAILKMSANGFGIRTLVQPGDSLPTGNIQRVQLISPRVHMGGNEGVGILLECCTDAVVRNAYVTNIGSGTFSYNDGLGSDTYTSGGIYLKGISGVYGCYFSHIDSPRTNGGGLGIWLGTSSSLRTSKANMNLITNPVCQSSTTGILIYTGDDNLITKPEVSLCTTGVRVGVPGGGVYQCNRNRFFHVYMENATTGMNITTESSSTVVDGVGSIVSTTTPFTDNGFGTAIFYPKRLAADEYARFYDKEVRGVSGIKFLATQEASSDANTLDDYEEGQFNATIEGTTSAGVGTYSDQTGVYTKVGREIMFDISLQWTAHTGTGDLRVAGLPFTSASGRSIPCSVYIISGLPLASGPVIQGLVAGGATTITLSQYNGTTVAPIPMDTAAFIRISGRYRV